VLLNIFDHYRPDLGEYDDRTMTVRFWHRQRWWYKLAHVCRQWRNIILESPSRLDLHLYCAKDVPVADILARSPPLLPLTINYHVMDRMVMTAEDESGLLLALSQRDRVRHVLFWMLSNVGKFVTVMDDQFPLLERMHIDSRTDFEVDLPVTFQAPNLRHLKLWMVSIPIGSPLLTTATGLVTLELLNIPASANLPPSYIRTRISLMAQLERLSITFQYPIPIRVAQSQSPQTPDTITLANLQSFLFKGVSTYLEGLVARITAPSLNRLHVYLFDQFLFTVPHLLQFMQTSENLTLNAVQVTFGYFSVSLRAVPGKWDTPLLLQIESEELDWQVASAMQVFGALSPVLSVVEQVTFSYEEHNQSLSEWHNNVDRRLWRGLLRPFINAKTIHVQDDLVSKMFSSLLSDDGEPPLELLPSLEQVRYSGLGGSDAQDAVTRFINERQAASHPVSLDLVHP
jgi:hypothetical protein